MCGRYELHSNPAAIALAFGLEHAPSIRPRYNVAPMQEVPIVRVSASGVREFVPVRWGLVPRWAKDPSIGNRMINARGETVATKPAFRTAFRRHRCLVPANGFYEWRLGARWAQAAAVAGDEGRRTFGFAGLYERWLGPDGQPLDSCTILTTGANELIAQLHDRMPVILAPADLRTLARARGPRPAGSREPFDGERMTYYPVSRR